MGVAVRGWLGGESGVGKTRFVNEIRIRALVQGALVLRNEIATGMNASDVVGDIPHHLLLSFNPDPEEESVIQRVVRTTSTVEPPAPLTKPSPVHRPTSYR